MRKQTVSELFLEEYNIKNENNIDNYVRTGVLSVDLLTMGKGLPLGKFIHIWSPAGYGKTTLIYSVIKNLVLSGESVLWVGVEGTQAIAEAMGLIVNGKCIDGFRYVDISFYNDLQKITDGWLELEGFRWMVIDSLTALCPPLDKMKEDILNTAIGLEARIEAKYLRLYHAQIKKHRKSIIFITQTRMQIDIRPGGVTKENASGGKATEFYSDLRIKIIGNYDVYSSTIEHGKENYLIGKLGYLMAEKNRHALPFVRIPTTILFGKGVSNIEILFEYAKWREFVTGQGWYSCSLDKENIEKIQGQAKVKEWIETNSSFFVSDFYSNVQAFFKFIAQTNGKKTREISSVDS